MTPSTHRTIRTFWSVVALLFLLGTVAAPAQAQLRKLKKKAKQVTSQQERDTPPTTEATPETNVPAAPVETASTSVEVPQAEVPAEDNPLISGATLIRNPDLPAPAITYFSILKGIQHSTFWRDGKFGFFSPLHGVFLPEVEGGKRYSPYGKGDAILAHQIKKADGTILQTNIFDGWPKDGPFYELSGLEFVDGFEAGDYVVEWFLEGDLFYRLPFTVEVMTSGDEYKPEPHYYIESAWTDMMVVYQPNGGSSPVEFGFWFRDTSYERDRFTQYWWKIDVKRNGKLVALLPLKKERDERKQKIVTGGEDIRPWWQFREFMPRKVGTSNDLFTRDDLTDGTYEVTYALVKEADGSIADEHTYTFVVSEGKIVPAGRQVRSETAPQDVIEGGEMDGNGHRFFFKPIQ